DQEAEGERDHVDPGPQRRGGEAVAVQGQPDALQPDDQHELEAAAADRGQQAGQVAGREGADPEQVEVEQRVGRAALDDQEHPEQGHSAEEEDQHQRAGPAHGVAAVGLDAVGDADQHGDQPDPEGEVAGPVDAPPGPAQAGLAELEVAPDGPEDAERHADQEHRPPVGLGQQPADQQPHERAGQGGHLVDPQGHAALVDREGVGEDGHRVGHDQRPADPLDDPQADQLQRRDRADTEGERQRDRGEGEDQEAGVAHLDPAVDVAQAPEGDHQHGADDQVAHQHPEQVADVPGLQGVELDPAEDGRQGDDHDRGVDGGDQHPQGRVGQGHPLVAVALSGHAGRAFGGGAGAAPAGARGGAGGARRSGGGARAASTSSASGRRPWSARQDDTAERAAATATAATSRAYGGGAPAGRGRPAAAAGNARPTE